MFKFFFFFGGGGRGVGLIPIEPFFHWVLEICKLQLEMAWFVACK